VLKCKKVSTIQSYITTVVLKCKMVSTIQSYIDSLLNLEAVSHHFAPWDIVCDRRNKQCGRTFGRDAVVSIYKRQVGLCLKAFCFLVYAT
jgi:hypothetical protein